MRRKEEPRRYCWQCGARMHRKVWKGRLEDLTTFKNRKYCDRICASLGLVGRQKADVCRSAYLWRARKLRKDACEECGSTEKLSTHHKDRDWRNSDPENLVTLCISCHLKGHWKEEGGLFASRRWVPAEPLDALLTAAELAAEALQGTEIGVELYKAIVGLRHTPGK